MTEKRIKDIVKSDVAMGLLHGALGLAFFFELIAENTTHSHQATIFAVWILGIVFVLYTSRSLYGLYILKFATEKKKREWAFLFPKEEEVKSTKFSRRVTIGLAVFFVFFATFTFTVIF